MNILDNVEYILGCTSTYPTKKEELNLKYIHTLKENYPSIKIGFSNHYNGLDAVSVLLLWCRVCRVSYY